MSETETPAAPRLWTLEGFREDEWTRAESADAPAGNARIILPLEALLSLDGASRENAGARLGVHVLPGEPIEPLLPCLASLSLVSLAFPAFNDGRGYSKAALLRTRHGFRGEIRAAGDVLIDQIPLMIRAGFSQFEVTNEIALRRLEEGRRGGLPFLYQPSSAFDTAGPRYSWRRLPAA